MIDHRVFAGKNERPGRIDAQADHFHVRRNISQPVVSDRIGILADFRSNSFRGRQQQRIGGENRVVILLAEPDDGLEKIYMGSGINFPG
jgi:hypothetical protein